MPSITVQVSYKDTMRAFQLAPEQTARTIRIELKQQLAEVMRRARIHHRFTTRTGMLERSIEQDVDQSGLIGIVFLNLGIAKYGAYVHEGHHSWRPDRFLYDAFEQKKNEIYAAMEKAVHLALKKVGLL